MATSFVRVYLACSIDGFIAGPDHDLSWLPETSSDPVPEPHADLDEESEGLGYEDFIAGVGALLMGRSTYDVVRGFEVAWPYGERPVLVATRRPLDPDPPSTVRAVTGDITDLIREAKTAAEPKDVYLDGGSLIRQAAEADLIDELVITIVPTALGHGIPLFAGLKTRYALEIVSHHRVAPGMVQIRARPRRPGPPASTVGPGADPGATEV